MGYVYRQRENEYELCDMQGFLWEIETDRHYG